MDGSAHRFAYRCLPLTIANEAGWEVALPCPVTATWDGGLRKEAISVVCPVPGVAVSHFGEGVLTFHVDALFRTEPGWGLWTGGPPNMPKDGIAPLTGLVETDWAPYTFTMNWIFTRPGTVHFSESEPYCFVFPIQVRACESFAAEFVAMAGKERDDHLAWSAARGAFNTTLSSPDQWQKSYMQGRDQQGLTHEGHATKLMLRRF